LTLATIAEDRKKLSYFLQNEFLAAYNEIADQLQDAMSNFVKAESSA
jgi:hypothetical protein